MMHLPAVGISERANTLLSTVAIVSHKSFHYVYQRQFVGFILFILLRVKRCSHRSVDVYKVADGWEKLAEEAESVMNQQNGLYCARNNLLASRSIDRMRCKWFWTLCISCQHTLLTCGDIEIPAALLCFWKRVKNVKGHGIKRSGPG